MMAAPAATTARTSSSDAGLGFPAATSLAGSAHSLTRMRSLSADRSVTGHTDIPSPSSSNARSFSSLAFPSSALMVISTHCLARSHAASRSSTCSHWQGKSSPSSSSASASSISAAGTRAISVCAFVDHAMVSSMATFTESRSLGWTGRLTAPALSSESWSSVGSSARAGLCRRPGSARRTRSLHACAAATASLSLRAEVISMGPRVTSAASEMHFLGFMLGVSASVETTRDSRSSPAARTLRKISSSSGGNGKGAASRSCRSLLRDMRRGGATPPVLPSLPGLASLFPPSTSISSAPSSVLTSGLTELGLGSFFVAVSGGCGLSSLPYLPPRRRRRGAPAAAAATMSASSSSGSSHPVRPSTDSSSPRLMRRLRMASSFWNAMAMETFAATLRTSSMSVPAHVNSSAAIMIASSSAVGVGGDFCSSASLARLTHAAARFCLDFAAPKAFSFSLALARLPHARSVLAQSRSSCAMLLR